jgi:hypothetical protein
MLTELQSSAGRSAQLDQILAQYLHNNCVALDPIFCPPWRNEGRQSATHAEAPFDAGTDARPLWPAYSTRENARLQQTT